MLLIPEFHGNRRGIDRERNFCHLRLFEEAKKLNLTRI